MTVNRHADQSPALSNRALLGYCTNVHPGVSLEQIKQNLERESLEVKRRFSPDLPMAIGLWLSSTATQELMNREERFRFRDWLQQRELVPYTVNAFPAGDFHQKVVKHDVYQPTWAAKSRMEYTCRVATILTDLLPSGTQGTISTLPLGWPTTSRQELNSPDSDEFLRTSGQHLLQTALALAELEEKHDVHLRICIEPEPGCVLDSADDVIQYFERFLFCADRSASELSLAQRHLGVCHDICHSAVMFEPQTVALEQYAQANIVVGKVQVSSAIEVNFDLMDASTAAQAISQLAAFAEPRYLHQTSIQKDGFASFFEDLPLALHSIGSGNPAGIWRVHFHVPIHEPTFGQISSTQSEILRCVQWFKDAQQPGCHFEVETYAWNVLPESLQPSRLADGIADELKWFAGRFSD